MLIDSHCHLDYFEGDALGATIDRAHAAGVGGMVSIGTTLKQSRQLLDIVAGRDNLWCTAGVHPQHVHDEPLAEAAQLLERAKNPNVIGFGESGLDYFHNNAPRSLQQDSFRVHLQAARIAQLPLVIHTRAADDDTVAILQEAYRAGPFPFVLHCFTGGKALAATAIELGGYVSFSGILTFPKSAALREIAATLPIDRILVETDAPYLAPAPHRGQRNEPGWVVHTAETLAGVRGMAFADLATATTTNFLRLFSKAQLACA